MSDTAPARSQRIRRLPVNAKWYHLYEEKEDFQIWYDNNAVQSQTTATEYARTLYRYLKEQNTTIEELTELITKHNDRFEKRLMAFANQLSLKNKSPSYINSRLKPLRSWARYQGKPVRRKIKVGNMNRTPTLDNEKPLTPEQVSEIRSNASMRGRISVGGLAYSGLRPEVLGHQHYEDGLVLGDLPELDITKLEFTKIPTQVKVPSELNKANHSYRTFFPPSTCRDIIAYLKKRRGQGEELTKNSALIAVASSHANKGARQARGRTKTLHVLSAIVSRDIRKAMRPNYKQRPYALRTYFSTRTLLSVNDGSLNDNYRSYWMGHKGSMSAHYSTNRNNLPEDLIESMRKAYQKTLPYLVGGGRDEDALRRKMLIDAARLYGLPDNQVQQIEQMLGNADSVDDAIREITRAGITIIPSVESQKKARVELELSHGDYVFVNSGAQLAKYLNDGYEWVREVSPEASKDSIEDETWVMPDGRTLSNGEKVYTHVNSDGSIEMRGTPDKLNGIEEELVELGISLDKIDSGPRYLLRKKRT